MDAPIYDRAYCRIVDNSRKNIVRWLFMVKRAVGKNKRFLFNPNGIFFEIVSLYSSSTNAHNEWHTFGRKKKCRK